MTVALDYEQVARRLSAAVPDSVLAVEKSAIVVRGEKLKEVAEFLKTDPDFDFDYLANLTAVDYLDRFEVVYHLVSLAHNHSVVLKVRCYDRLKPVVPSVVSVWRAADFQEREVYDLMGVVFQGHPNLKRLFLWEGFAGHPLRKDYL